MIEYIFGEEPSRPFLSSFSVCMRGVQFSGFPLRQWFHMRPIASLRMDAPFGSCSVNSKSPLTPFVLKVTSNVRLEEETQSFSLKPSTECAISTQLDFWCCHTVIRRCGRSGNGFPATVPLR